MNDLVHDQRHSDFFIEGWRHARALFRLELLVLALFDDVSHLHLGQGHVLVSAVVLGDWRDIHIAWRIGDGWQQRSLARCIDRVIEPGIVTYFT